MTHTQFYVQRFAPTSAWPNGGWSLYNTSADDIARRVGFDEHGKVDRRDGLLGYIGTFGSVEELAAAMVGVA